MVGVVGLSISIGTAAFIGIQNALNPRGRRNPPQQAPAPQAPVPAVQPQPAQGGPQQAPERQAQQNRANPDHVFARGFGRSLPRLSISLGDAWPELSRALDDAARETQTAPFGLVVNLQRPRPDPHSVAFGTALAELRNVLSEYTDAIPEQGVAFAVMRFQNQILTSWNNLVDLVEDPVAAAACNQQALVRQGRASLRRIRGEVGAIIQRGP